MRDVHAGGTAKRPFFADDEFERIAQEELLGAGLLPSEPQAVRVERFIEKRFRVTPQYEALTPGLLGYTEFGPEGVRAIIVSRDLSEDGARVAERRINTTLAHEAGHGLLHTHLFVLDSFPRDLFENAEDVGSTRILCRQENEESVPRRKYDGRWWEVQANRMMGALLLPRKLVGTALTDLMVARGALGALVLPDDVREEAKHRLSDAFDVNPIVAQIRMNQLYPLADGHQLTL